MSSNTHEQFIFTEYHDWLNGYDIANLDKNRILNRDFESIAFAFYAQKRNEIFIVEWNLK